MIFFVARIYLAYNFNSILTTWKTHIPDSTSLNIFRIEKGFIALSPAKVTIPQEHLLFHLKLFLVRYIGLSKKKKYTNQLIALGKLDESTDMVFNVCS